MKPGKGARAGLLLGLALSGTVAPAAAQMGRRSPGLEERPYLRIKPGSEERRWGNVVLIQLVSRGARAAAAAVPGSVALVGDLSSRDGGPLPGHVSHRAGCDADVAFMVADGQGRPVLLDVFEAFGADGRSLLHPDHHFDAYRSWLMLREWLTELRVVVTHVFVSAELRLLLLDYGRQSPEFGRLVPLAEQVLHEHPTHTDHFHLRIACPTGLAPAYLDEAPFFARAT